MNDRIRGGTFTALLVGLLLAPAASAFADTVGDASSDGALATELREDVTSSDTVDPDITGPAHGEEANASRRWRLTAGPLVAMRSMSQGGDRNEFDHDAPFYMGAQLSAALELYHLSSSDAVVFLTGEAGFGRTIGAYGNAHLANRSTMLTFGTAQLVLRRPAGTDWELDFGLGVQATSTTVEQNPTYTGHRYFGLIAGGTARRYFQDRQYFAAGELYALPVLSVNLSHEAPEAQSFGLRAGLQLGWTSPNGWQSTLGYRFQRFRSQFPLSAQGSRGAVSEDDHHIFMLSIGYAH